MGTKIRSFSPLPPDVSLGELVPRDHFYRRLEEVLDLSFVREPVVPFYAGGGRPSVDPVVFFKLQLVMFFEDLRSERRLMQMVADSLSLRWYLGYDLHELLPDHSSLTRVRERYCLAFSTASSSGSWSSAPRRSGPGRGVLFRRHQGRCQRLARLHRFSLRGRGAPGQAHRAAIIILSFDDSALVNALQRKAAVVLQKSIREGFGLTVAEAMWKGTPVIGGDVGGIRHQIEDGENGFLVSSVEEAAERIVRLIEDEDLREQMGGKAKESVRERFLLTRYLEQYLDLLGSFETVYRLPPEVGR